MVAQVAAEEPETVPNSAQPKMLTCIRRPGSQFNHGANAYALIAILALIYIVLGTALDGISMIVLTTSVVLPIVEKAGFDLVWFGVFIVLLVEIAEVTPPLGFNLFVLQTMSGKDSLYVARASIPFFFMLVAAIALITAFPGIATWLPEALMTRS